MIQELHAGATNLVYQAMLELRPSIGPESVFVEHVDTVQRPEGYRVVGFFVEDDVQAVAAAGFRIVNMLAWGRTPFTAMTSRLGLSIAARVTQAS
jgi:hypothetical protein